MLAAAFGPRAHLVPLVARFVVGGAFLAAGVLKVSHPADLAAAITAFQLGIPPTVSAAIAVGMPLLEILLGAYLLAGWLLPLSSAVATVLLAVFTLVLTSVVARGIDAPCGCFGPADQARASWWGVARDGLLLLPAAYLSWWSRARAREQETGVDEYSGRVDEGRRKLED